MQRKMEIRFQPGQPVHLSVLSDAPQTLTAFINSLDGRHASLKATEAIPAGSAIRVDLEDSMLIGEITGCAATDGQFEIQLHVNEAIPSMSDLARLVSALMCEGRRDSVADPRRPQIASAK